MVRNRKNRKVILKKNQTAERMNNTPKANQKYKDTVFRMLFSDKKNLLSLYNAINRTEYDDPEKLQTVTLENAIYMGMKNDLAFIIDMNLFLYEHQSTYNPNIPLRDLFYISAEYQKLVDRKSLYSSSLQKIPAPYFIVFYNGTEKQEEYWENSLSDAYENLNGEPKLELKVITLNINEGHNRELLEQCQTLREYAQYVTKVRKYAKEMNLDEAVERTVNECIQEGILKDFLRANRNEVIAMSIFEYDKEEEEKKLRKAEYEAGIQVGRQEGIQETKKEIALQMLKAGVSGEEIVRFTGYTVEQLQKIKETDI
jgi:predicted transposase/invertase (TIGR01784 family)